MRREVAVVRGSVLANRIEEGENLYGDEIEPGTEEKIGMRERNSAAVVSPTGGS